MLRLAAPLGLALCALVLPACQQRSLTITSEPEGARVWLNDVDVGRTPVEVDFKWYGIYDVRISKEGYEPLITAREASAPVWEYPVVDLVTAPFPLHDRQTWHFDLVRTPESLNRAAAEQDLVQRAKEMREQTAADAPAPPAAAPQ